MDNKCQNFSPSRIEQNEQWYKTLEKEIRRTCGAIGGIDMVSEDGNVLLSCTRENAFYEFRTYILRDDSWYLIDKMNFRVAKASTPKEDIMLGYDLAVKMWNDKVSRTVVAKSGVNQQQPPQAV